MQTRNTTASRRWRTRRGMAAVAGAMLVASGLAACASEDDAGASGDALTFAMTGEQTGAAATTFQPAIDGAQAAIEAINANGGINGQQIEVAGPFDSQSVAAGGSTAAQQASSADPDAVISLGTSLTVSAGLPVYKQSDVPVFNISGSDDSQSPEYPNSLSTHIYSGQMGTVLVAKAAELAGGPSPRIGVIGNETPSVSVIIEAVKEAAGAAEVEIVDVQTTSDTQTSFESQANAVASKDPDVVITVDFADKTIQEVKALRVAGFDGPVMSTHGGASDSTFQAIDDSEYYALRLNPQPAEGSDLYNTGQDQGIKVDAIASNYFAAGWTIVYTAKAVLEQCGGDCTGADIRAAADEAGEIEIPEEGTFGPISFADQRQYGLTAVQFYKWAGSKVVPSGDPVSTD